MVTCFGKFPLHYMYVLNASYILFRSGMPYDNGRVCFGGELVFTSTGMPQMCRNDSDCPMAITYCMLMSKYGMMPDTTMPGMWNTTMPDTAMPGMWNNTMMPDTAMPGMWNDTMPDTSIPGMWNYTMPDTAIPGMWNMTMEQGYCMYYSDRCK